jgi:hypothetical protein
MLKSPVATAAASRFPGKQQAMRSSYTGFLDLPAILR